MISPLLGTVANAGAILLGGLLGLAMKRDLAPRHQVFLKTLLGALTALVGFRMVWAGVGGSFGRVTLQIVVALLALLVGNLLGAVLRLQRGVNRLGRYARERFEEAQRSPPPRAGDGFIACTLLFCLGPLAIVGALQEGLRDDPGALLIKAAVDGLSAFGLARVFGPGALAAALPLLAYQGIIALAGRLLRPELAGTPAMLDGFGVVAGLLVTITSLVILDVRKVRLADYLPALIAAPFLRLWLG